MKPGRQHRTGVTRRRTTLTLPADSLIQAERIARARRVNLSIVISEALENGLRMHAAAERSQQVLNAYQKAFKGLSDEEVLLLDGIVLDPPGERR